MWMITGEQMIPNPSKQKANYQFMQGMASIEQQGKAAKKNEMFAMAKTNYYEWIVLQKKYYVLSYCTFWLTCQMTCQLMVQM